MKYEVWSEGYKCSGNESKAEFHGKVEANCFKDACDKLFLEKTDEYDYDPDSLDLWGCKLYDNEEDARKAFG